VKFRVIWLEFAHNTVCALLTIFLRYGTVATVDAAAQTWIERKPMWPCASIGNLGKKARKRAT
jgi:hypothetical protein